LSDRGRLYLVPVALGGDAQSVLPPATLSIVRGLDRFIAENAKSARAFLKTIGHPRPLQEIHIDVLDEHTRVQDVAPLLEPLLAGRNVGLLSEAGCPGVADPGAVLVRQAHAAGLRVVPLVGPSSILLALMASGMDGQRFRFRGYLPVDKVARAKMITQLEAQSSGETQIFIETPYRTAAMRDALLEHGRPDTHLCIAADLTLPGEFVATRTIVEWKKKPPDIDRRLVVFLLWRK
jgi:16S rRNA (cytidine1402-2'-O)-methyltransferase